MSTATDFELYDSHEPDTYLNFADYQRIYEEEQQQKAAAHNDTADSAQGGRGRSDQHPIPADSMAAIRMSVMLSQANNPGDEADRFPLGFEPTAYDLLTTPMHPEQEERQITRLMRRCGLEADRSCTTANGAGGMRMATTRESAYGKAPTRLAVAGLRNVYIDDSYFKVAANRTLAAVAKVGGADERRRAAEAETPAAGEVAEAISEKEKETIPALQVAKEAKKKVKTSPKQPSEKESAKSGQKQRKFVSCKEAYMKRNMKSDQ